MGLDMHLHGEKFLWTNWKEPEKNRTEDGLKIDRIVVDLHYWRKHPNLHGAIVQNFAGGKDECQKIELDANQLRNLIKAVEAKDLPLTEGFFFGKSYGNEEERAEDLKALNAALEWLETKEDGVSRSVYYRASW